MSIRYECAQCGSVLKIKNDLAGKPGKCPKCKTPFTVPSADTDVSIEPETTETSDHLEPESVRQSSDSSGDFDVDAFLMSESDPKTTKSRPESKDTKSTKTVDAEQTLDEIEEKPKSKRSKAIKTDDKPADDSFQIRRGPDAPGKAYPSYTSDSDDEPAAAATQGKRPPGTNPNAPASNIASDLLSKSAKKGRKSNWDEVEPEKMDKPEFDWAGLWYEARTKLLPVMGGGAVVCLIVYFFISPMFSSRSNIPPLATVSGTITVDGKPMVGAIVFFHPEKTKEGSGKDAFKIATSSGQTDASGKYELNYDSDHKGVAIGKCRVEIMTANVAGISQKYLRDDKDSAKVEIKPGNQVINLDLSK